MTLHCDTCGRRVDPSRPLKTRGYTGALVIHDHQGDVTAYCPQHARHRPPWFGKAGWAWMREYDRLWERAEAVALLESVKHGSRDLTFHGSCPFIAGERIDLTKRSWAVVEWVREPRPATFTARIRRFEEERERFLRTGPLPFTDLKRIDHRVPDRDEIERARIDGAYQTGADPLDAGACPPEQIQRQQSVAARLRHAERARRAIERR